MRFLANSLARERESASEAEDCIVQLMNLVITYQGQILENQNVEWDINEITTNFSLRIAELQETKYQLECHIKEQELQKKEMEYAVYFAEQEAAKYAAQAANTALREASLSARIRRKSHGNRGSASASSSSTSRRVSTSRSSRVSTRHSGHTPVLSLSELPLSEEKSSKPPMSREPSATDCSPPMVPMRPELSVSASVPALFPRSSSSKSIVQSKNMKSSATPLLLPSATTSKSILDLPMVLVDSSLAAPRDASSPQMPTSHTETSNAQHQVHNSSSNTPAKSSTVAHSDKNASSAPSRRLSPAPSRVPIQHHSSSLSPQLLSQHAPGDSSALQESTSRSSPSQPILADSADPRHRRAGARHQVAFRSPSQPILAEATDPRQRRAGARHRLGRAPRDISHRRVPVSSHWNDRDGDEARDDRDDGAGATSRERSKRRSSSRVRALGDTPPTAFDPLLVHAPSGTPDSARIRFSPSKVIELEKRLNTMRLQNEDLEAGEAELMRETRYLRQALDDAEKRYAAREAAVTELEKSKSDHKKMVGTLQQRVKAEIERCQALHTKFENLKFQFHYGDTEKDKRIDELSEQLDQFKKAAGRGHTEEEEKKMDGLIRRCKRLEQRLEKVKNKRVTSWIMEIDDPEVAANRRRRKEEPEPMIQTHEIFYEEVS